MMGSADGEGSEKMAPDSKKSSKFSFSMPSKLSSAKPKRRPSEGKEPSENEEDRPEFLSEFDPSKPATQKVKVIPKLENSWRPEKRMKNIQMTESELKFEPETEAPAGTQPAVEYGLNLRTHEMDQKIDVKGSGFVKEDERQRLKTSVEELPDEMPMEAYESLPVEDFGAALLRGMGWSEGMGIGGKEPVKPVEYVRRVGREGLGATPAPPVEKPKKFLKPGESKEGRKDLVAAPAPDGRIRHVVGVGEQLVERQRMGVAVGKVMTIVEGRHVGLRGEVIEVLGNSGGSVRVVLRLSKSEEKVVVGVGEVADMGSVEEEECLRRIKKMRADGSGNGRDRNVQKGKGDGYKDDDDTKSRSRDRDTGSRDEKRDRGGGDYRSRDDLGRREKERDYRFRDEKRDSRSRDRLKSSYDDIRDERRHDRRGDDRERESQKSELHKEKVHQSEKGQRKEDDREDKYYDRKDGRREDYYPGKGGTSRRDERDGKRESRDKGSEIERVSTKKEMRVEQDRRNSEFEVKKSGKNRPNNEGEENVRSVSWLRSHIRVRIISKDFQGGKLYLKKGRVIDVVGPTTCDLLMDENGVVVQGVKQDILETALPKRGGLIIVVEGEHRGILGKLMERDSDKGFGVVQKEDTYEMLTLSLDNIAEFVGDPGELDY